MSGFGDRLLEAIRLTPGIDTVAAAKEAGVSASQAYSRLVFMENNGGRVHSVGKGQRKRWSVEKLQLTGMVAEKRPVRASVMDEGDRGWKPSLDRFPSLVESAPAKKGDKLLVQYPERWRHSIVVSLVREPDASGVALCWDMRNRQHCYVDVSGFRARGWEIGRVVGEKAFEQIMSEQ